MGIVLASFLIGACTTEVSEDEPTGFVSSEVTLPTVPRSLATVDSQSVLGALEAARQRWAHSGIRSYRYTIRVTCFCSALYAEVTVLDGVVTRVKPLLEGDHEWVRRVLGKTIEERIVDLERSALFDPDHMGRFSLTFDVDTGMPLTGSIDPSRLAIDEEWNFEITDFVDARLALSLAP